jgi:hypothetical protein
MPLGVLIILLGHLYNPTCSPEFVKMSSDILNLKVLKFGQMTVQSDPPPCSANVRSLAQFFLMASLIYIYGNDIQIK